MHVAFTPVLNLFRLTTTSMLFSSIPSELGQLRQLEYLRLDRNRFTGNIANAFGVHPSLRFIDLSDNQFVGRLSPQ
ncbi:hypothetical protein DVH24_028743 [Malus domestica]|uniref:Leucine-rich repeat-containing N-terminal plant-type domain-containing protein n=1 Tax=Malus domestica TaxID=3750 RepID=A0A498J0C6_MALDO|nr:hypothetical protein DVH24_028743 [Malus domestica]